MFATHSSQDPGSFGITFHIILDSRIVIPLLWGGEGGFYLRKTADFEMAIKSEMLT